ncbi:glycosyltransferase (plasmid) [Pedobacter sp. BS3]|uniref:XrtY-associated glycosyltransferase XYAG1 n=1 Tax=Pedobacter sp. BS3 TaxID=2567937 RepID=UPI0011EFA7A8|nr:glycosyltransferase [Pedobacter sp. BS3]TZF86217.1 glycosyltransferase [Pedobacter sp. BS3]
MHIIQINASYKPAYIYGGPTMSVSRLSEALAKGEDEVKVEQDKGINKLTDQQINKDETAIEAEAEIKVEDKVKNNSKINASTNKQLNKAGVEDEHNSAINSLTNKQINNLHVEVLTTTANGSTELEGIIPGKQVFVDGVPVRYFKRLTKDHSHFSPALLWHLHKQLQRRTINQSPNHPINNTGSDTIIHIHAWWNLVSVFSVAIALWHSYPVILSPRGTLSTYSFCNRNSPVKKLFHYFIGKPLLQRCHFHVTSEKEKQDICRLLDPKSISVIPNFVLLEEGQETGNKRQETRSNKQEIFRLVFLSRVEEKKGLDKLFDALAWCNRPWELAIAGDGQPGYLEQLKSQAAALGIDQHIRWLGHLGQEEKFTVLQQHDLLILPSHDENFANVVIESLSVGTAVLISTNVGLADYVQHKQLGWVCEAKPEIIAQHIVQAMEDIAMRTHIREAAPDIIRRDFDEHVLVKRYLAMYEDALSG